VTEKSSFAYRNGKRYEGMHKEDDAGPMNEGGGLKLEIKGCGFYFEFAG